MVAASAFINGFGGKIYLSADSGGHWIDTGAPAQVWSDVACSADGSNLVAVVKGGGIYTRHPRPADRIRRYRLDSGAFILEFNGDAGAIYAVEASPDLSEWSELGTASELAPGQFQFTDWGAAFEIARFYRLRIP